MDNQKKPKTILCLQIITYFLIITVGFFGYLNYFQNFNEYSKYETKLENFKQSYKFIDLTQDILNNFIDLSILNIKNETKNQNIFTEKIDNFLKELLDCQV